MVKSVRCFCFSIGSTACSQRCSGIVVILLSVFMGRAEAATYPNDSRTLAQSYEQSDSIFVAQVLGCADDAAPVNGACPKGLYYFQFIEVLKEPVPWRDLSGIYPDTHSSRNTGAGSFRRGCVTGQGPGSGMPCFNFDIALGASYLPFLDDERKIDWTVSGDLNAISSLPEGIPSEAQMLQAYLAILRDFRDGKIADLAEPWVFMDSGTGCRLEHYILGQHLSFFQLYDDSQFQSEFRAENIGDGRQRWVSRIPEQSPMGQLTKELILPEIQFGSLTMFARFGDGVKAVPNTARISIGERSWSLQASTFTVRNGVERMVSFEQDVVQGEAAEQIFKALLDPVDITVTKRAAPLEERGADQQPTVQPADLLIETRSTQFAASVGQFTACVERNQR